MKLDQLNEEQRGQVRYKFADLAFEVNPGDYEYEVDAKGSVTGRVPIMQTVSQVRSRIRPGVKVNVLEALEQTDEMIRQARMHMDALAAQIARNLYEERAHREEIACQR